MAHQLGGKSAGRNLQSLPDDGADEHRMTSAGNRLRARKAGTLNPVFARTRELIQ